MANCPFAIFTTETILMALALGGLILDIFLRDDEKRGSILANVSMIGLSIAFAQLLFQWNRFGAAFNGSFVQDTVAFYFKLIFLLAGFLALFMAREY
jgi:NADH:ubiquinone oxidoreductase subunit 2 (subunit N)